MAYDFNSIAPTYDRLNHVMTFGLDRRWRKKAVAKLSSLKYQSSKSSQLTLLDVACGTGDLTIEAARQYPSADITSVDISDEMLSIARQKTELSNFLLADAEALPFADASFDAVVSAFGIRNFVHLETGLKEMLRVLKPGGLLIILELSTPDSLVVRPFYNFYAKRIIPWLGSRIAGNREAYTYLPASIERFPKGSEFIKIIDALGATTQQQKLFFGVCRLYVTKK